MWFDHGDLPSQAIEYYYSRVLKERLQVQFSIYLAFSLEFKIQR